jgi:hypothetical protein
LLIHNPEFKARGSVDQFFGSSGVLNSRELNKNSVLSLSGDAWFTHTKLVNSISDCFYALVYGSLFEIINIEVTVAEGVTAIDRPFPTCVHFVPLNSYIRRD